MMWGRTGGVWNWLVYSWKAPPNFQQWHYLDAKKKIGPKALCYRRSEACLPWKVFLTQRVFIRTTNIKAFYQFTFLLSPDFVTHYSPMPTSNLYFLTSKRATVTKPTANHPLPPNETLPKAQRTRGLSSSCQSNFLKSYHKFKHKSWPHFFFRISTKHQLKI